MTYLSSNNSISTVEVLTVHVHGASFALCNSSSSPCVLETQTWGGKEVMNFRKIFKMFLKKEFAD